MTVLSIPNRAVAQVATRRRVLVRPATELTRMTRYRGGTYSTPSTGSCSPTAPARAPI